MLELLITGFFTGYISRFPGTAASLFTTFTFFITYSIFNFSRISFFIFLIYFLTLSFLLLKEYINKNKIKNDSSKIVIDEFSGQLIAIAFVPFHLYYIILSFVIFRIFDIWKPFGIRKLERIQPLYISIMADDILAGIYTGICILVFHLFFTNI